MKFIVLKATCVPFLLNKCLAAKLQATQPTNLRFPLVLCEFCWKRNEKNEILVEEYQCKFKDKSLMSVLLLTAETMGKDSKYCSIHMSNKTTKIKQLSLRLHLWYLLVSFLKIFFLQNFSLKNSRCCLSAGASYTLVFAVLKHKALQTKFYTCLLLGWVFYFDCLIFIYSVMENFSCYIKLFFCYYISW